MAPPVGALVSLALLLPARSADRKESLLPFGGRGGIESGLLNAPRFSSLLLGFASRLGCRLGSCRGRSLCGFARYHLASGHALYNEKLITVLADRRRPERVASIILRQADDAGQEPKVCRLTAGGNWIRNSSSALPSVVSRVSEIRNPGRRDGSPRSSFRLTAGERWIRRACDGCRRGFRAAALGVQGFALTAPKGTPIPRLSCIDQNNVGAASGQHTAGAGSER